MPRIGDIQYGKTIGKKPPDMKFIWLACADCGKERWNGLFNQHSYCRLCIYRHRKWVKPKYYHGSEHPHWKGGRFLHPKGYFYIWVGRDDFFSPMANNTGYVRENRLVMARHLGRNLHPWEFVHHKNGNKQDNRLENLQFISYDKHNQITVLGNRINHLENKIRHLEAKIVNLKANNH